MDWRRWESDVPTRSGWLAAVFSVLLALVAAGASLSTWTLVNTMHDVSVALPAHVELLQQTERLHRQRERKGRQARNYLLTGDAHFLDEFREAREELGTIRRRLGALMDEPKSAELLSEVGRENDAHSEILDRFLQRRRAGEGPEVLGPELGAAIAPYRERLDDALLALDNHVARTVMAERGYILAGARRSVLFLLVLAPSTFALALALVALVLRTARLLRASEIALAHQLARVQEANRDLDAFAGRVAHDFRSLLNPLSFMAKTLRNGAGSSEHAEQVADRLTRLSSRAERELEALLAFARAGRKADGKASTSLSDAVEQAVEDLAHAASAARLEVSLDVRDVAVAVSPGLLQAVVSNLVGNAIKFVAGRPTRVVKVRGGREDGLCVLEVEDSGPGIAPDNQARIFEPFYRAPGAPTGGAGIGLATVHRIVQAHNGRITLRSVVGEGTIFRVILPLAEGAP